METKRCAQCHKLLRAETQTCSRCGYTFTEKKRQTTTRDLTRPSLPPASPHRAGHYSGLHPEDQPYQSSMIAVQRPPAQELKDIRRLPELVREEPELPTSLPIEDDRPTQINVRYEKPRTEVSVPHIQHLEPIMALPMHFENPLQDTDGVLPVLYQPRQLKKTPTAKHTIPALLILSCLFFLLASGILVYVLTMGKAPLPPSLQLSTSPSVVRSGDPFTLSGKGFTPSTQVKFTYDAHEQPIKDSMQHQLEAVANRVGTFSVDVIAPASWSIGQHTIYATDEEQQSSISTLITVEPPSVAPPLLQLLTTRIDLGRNRAGTTSTKQVILTNAGGGLLTWQQKSDAPWLTTAPTSNSYSFSGRASIIITANRSNLVPGPYIGHITFTQKDSSNTVKLTVTMSVDSAPAALNVSLSSLTFAATSAQSVPPQSVILQNSGGKSLNWQASATTNDGASWLYLIGASSGQIDPGQSQQLMVDVQAQQLAAGLYQGTITLTGGANATINVSLTVVAPGNILVTPTTLTFSALTGQSVTGKTLTMQNTGGQTQAWSAATTTADQGNWLSITQQSGSVSAGTQAQVVVNVNTAGLKASVYQGTLNFTIGNQLTSVPITLTVTTPPSPTISVQSTALTFQTTQGTNPLGQSLTITNTGNAVLNWAATESDNGATFAPLSASSGSISPQANTVVEVNPNVSASPAGTLKTTITIADSDAGTTVVSRYIAVTVVIQSEAAISASPTNFSLTATGTTPTTQTVTITNTGTAPLNWNALVHMEVPVGGTWLSVDTPSGTLAPGASKNIVVSCDGTGLPKGSTFQGSVQIVDSDTGSTVPPQTVYLTFFP